ncbi:MAG: response regulator [Acidimicrobiia bacterium]
MLVVDDERNIRDTVRLFLEQARYAVLAAATEQEALDVAVRLNPDLVVLDLMLPDLPGEAIARSLRAISEVPIIMLTGESIPVVQPPGTSQEHAHA